MNRKLFLLIVSLMLAGMFGQAATVAAAEETQTGEQTQTEAQAPAGTVTENVQTDTFDVSLVDKGWHERGGHTYYFKSRGKMATGWRKMDGKIYYFRKKADASTEAPKGSMAKGFCRIGKKLYYFSPKGALQYGGWKTIKGKNYYLTPSGSIGKLGALYTGLKKIDGNIFCFKEDGSASVGWTTYKEKRYFFSNGRQLGLRGRAITGWKKIGPDTYYFASNGVMQTNRWIDGRYVDKKGRVVTNGVSPAGYRIIDGKKSGLAKGWVNLNGKVYYYVSGKKTVGWKKIKGKKYYFNKNGVRKSGWLNEGGSKYYLEGGVVQTGWQTIGGKEYYFKSGGKMAYNTTVDGKVLGPDGAVVGQDIDASGAKVLLIAGHGQGDSGAVGYYSDATYYESVLTREFSSLILQQIKALDSGIQVEMYDQNYDCYQVMSGKKAGPKPNIKNYDYILEVHFNATVSSSKDPKGNGSFKGVGMYVNSAKKDTKIDRDIVSAIAQETGFKVWGGSSKGNGINLSSGLFNARTCQEAGVSYGLLESAFIDDRDDIMHYQKNKQAMARAAAKAICSYFAK